MANWITDKFGNWYPAHEHAVLPHLSGTDKEVYDGPDRAAMLELANMYGMDEEGKPKKLFIENDFRHDPDMVMRVKQLGYKDMKEYLKIHNFDSKKPDTDFEEKSKRVIKHELPPRRKGTKFQGGGKNTAGEGGKEGGFGDPKE